MPAGEMQVPYLELRSRRLVKRDKQREACSGLNVAERRLNSGEASRLRCSKGESVSEKENRCYNSDIEVEVSLGDKAADCDFTESSIRRETCSSNNLVMEQGALESTTSSTAVNSRREPPSPRVAAIMPSMAEIGEFFATFEQEEQRRFTEKYNYDTVKDIPLAGRYEWVKVTP